MTDSPKRPNAYFKFVSTLLVQYWRSLLLLLVGVFAPLWMFDQLALSVWHSGMGFPWDESLLMAVHASAHPALDRFAFLFTQLGVYWGVVPAAVSIGLVLLYRKRWRSLSYLLITLLGSAVINRTAKEFLHRVRPHLWNSAVSELDYGFPSGHAMSSMTFVAVLVILTWGSRWRGWILAIGIPFAVTIGWTRLYLGVHFPSDIFAGWMVSIAWAVGVSLLIRPRWAGTEQTIPEASTSAEGSNVMALRK